MDRLFTPKLKQKNETIFKILGPGTWLLYTQFSYYDDYYNETEHISDEELSYVPYKSLDLYGITTNDIEIIFDASNQGYTVITAINISPQANIEGGELDIGLYISYWIKKFN